MFYTLNLLCSQKILLRADKGITITYQLLLDKEEAIKTAKIALQKQQSPTPIETITLYQHFGFDLFLADIAEMRDRHGNSKSPYSFTELWLCRYVFFLDAARQYVFFKNSENALMEQELAKIKNKNKP